MRKSNKNSPIPVIVLVIAIVVLILAWNAHLGGLAFAGIFWGAASIVVVVAFAFNKKKETVNEEPLRKEVDNMIAEGKELHYEIEAQLNASDIATLKRTIRNTFLLIIGSAGFGWAIIQFFIGHGWFVYTVVSLVFLAIVAGALIQVSSCSKILKEDKKRIIRGVVTDRPKREHSSGDDKKIDYFLRIGDREIKVDKECYDRYKISDAVEIHFALSRGISPFIFLDKLISISN